MTTNARTSLNDERGAFIVESALTIGLFFLIIFMGCELLRLGYNLIVSQYVASKTLRQAVLGSTDTGAVRGDKLEDALIAQAAALGVNLGSAVAGSDNPNVTVCSLQAGNCASGDNAGNEEELISIHIRYPVQLFFGLGSYTVDCIVLGRNEPFTSI